MPQGACVGQRTATGIGQSQVLILASTLLLKDFVFVIVVHDRWGHPEAWSDVSGCHLANGARGSQKRLDHGEFFGSPVESLPSCGKHFIHCAISSAMFVFCKRWVLKDTYIVALCLRFGTCCLLFLGSPSFFCLFPWPPLPTFFPSLSHTHPWEICPDTVSSILLYSP